MPSATLYALEPAPARFAALKRALAHDAAALAFQAAIAGGRGPREISHDGRLAWLNALHGDHAITGDAFCEQNGVDAIDFLKVDTDGFDFVALQGFERMLRDRQIDILEVTASVSSMDSLGYTLDAFASYLAPFRYGVLAVFEKAYDRRAKELVRLDVLFRTDRS